VIGLSPEELVIIGLRLGSIGLLYLFLLLMMWLVYRELHAQPERGAGLSQLLVLSAGASHLQAGARIPLRTVNRMGREAASTILIDDPSVSLNHALLTERRGSWWVRDTESTNGTYLNGRPVQKDTQLRPGDELQLGEARFRFVA
jgi:predicted component of type VI protein secretion system